MNRRNFFARAAAFVAALFVAPAAGCTPRPANRWLSKTWAMDEHLFDRHVTQVVRGVVRFERRTTGPDGLTLSECEAAVQEFRDARPNHCVRVQDFTLTDDRLEFYFEFVRVPAFAAK
jgi:hypothetical protein